MQQVKDMILNVPLKREALNSLECGLSCLEMLYSFYNKDKKIEELRQEIPLAAIGSYAPQLGMNLLENGFDVEIVSFNPMLFSKTDNKLSNKELILKFETKYKTAKEEDKPVLNYFINFMKKGGKLSVKIPSINDLKEEIKYKRPVIALLTTASLYTKNIAEFENKPFNYTFHFVVVIGINEEKVIINDPLPGVEGGEKEYPMDEFLFAVHASSLGDLDNGCFVKIKNPRNL